MMLNGALMFRFSVMRFEELPGWRMRLSWGADLVAPQHVVATFDVQRPEGHVGVEIVVGVTELHVVQELDGIPGDRHEPVGPVGWIAPERILLANPDARRRFGRKPTRDQPQEHQTGYDSAGEHGSGEPGNPGLRDKHAMRKA